LGWERERQILPPGKLYTDFYAEAGNGFATRYWPKGRPAQLARKVQDRCTDKNAGEQAMSLIVSPAGTAPSGAATSTTNPTADPGAAQFAAALQGEIAQQAGLGAHKGHHGGAGAPCGASGGALGASALPIA
jgi:hypothetical protein